ESEREKSRGVLRSAAALLAQVAVDAGEAAQALLRHLDYGDSAPGLARHRAALLLAASRFSRIFTLNAPDAPNLVVLGADVDPAEFGLGDGPVGYRSGTGASFREAFEACVGEGVEYASQFASADDRLHYLAADEALAGAAPAWRELWERLASYRRRDGGAATAWTEAANLTDGEAVLVP